MRKFLSLLTLALFALTTSAFAQLAPQSDQTTLSFEQEKWAGVLFVGGPFNAGSTNQNINNGEDNISTTGRIRFGTSYGASEALVITVDITPSSTPDGDLAKGWDGIEVRAKIVNNANYVDYGSGLSQPSYGAATIDMERRYNAAQNSFNLATGISNVHKEADFLMKVKAKSGVLAGTYTYDVVATIQ